MTTTAILTMILVLGFTIGGFIYFLAIAIRKEKSRKRDTQVN